MLTPSVAEQMLRENKMNENDIRQILGQCTVSWGDKPPIMHPNDDLIAAVKSALAAKQDDTVKADEPGTGMFGGFYDFSCDSTMLKSAVSAGEFVAEPFVYTEKTEPIFFDADGKISVMNETTCDCDCCYMPATLSCAIASKKPRPSIDELEAATLAMRCDRKSINEFRSILGLEKIDIGNMTLYQAKEFIDNPLDITPDERRQIDDKIAKRLGLVTGNGVS